MPAMHVARRFGENLRKCRRRAGFSQEELGMRSELHRTEIGLLERGARVPRIDTLIKIASALRIPPAELIDGIEWAPGNTVSGTFQIAAKGDPQSN
jgi:transcriptional regulator with XRE-family HTH domain